MTHTCNVTIMYSPDYYPVTINDLTLYETFSKHAGTIVSDDGTLHKVDLTMGAEDFAFLGKHIRSTFFFLGQGSGMNPPTNYSVHRPHFALDERVLAKGVELHVNLALQSIGQLMLMLE
jgi:metal-dependent amidase/aminoacylase/carboxypeptidase family protein